MERFEYAVHLAGAQEGGFVVTCRAYMQGGIGFPAPTKAQKK